MSGEEVRPSEEGSVQPTLELTGLLVTSLEALAAVGEVDTACRVAGRACVLLRSADPRAARRFNALLHRLTPKLSW
ncbi:MAG TPA: hypothetical protein VFJ18_00765 [Pararhizobium sp.]|nr:hypothetical protein [Pararhizobium sp.]